MRTRLQGGLLYVPLHLSFRGRELVLDDVILDTGSAASVVSADAVLPIDLVPEPHDRLRRIRGVGGVEFVFTKRLDRLAVGDLDARDFEVEVGALDYGFPVQGILGLDFLLQDVHRRDALLGRVGCLRRAGAGRPGGSLQRGARQG